MKTLRLIAISLLLAAASLSACGSADTERETAAVEWQTANVIGMRPAETRDPNESIEFSPTPEVIPVPPIALPGVDDMPTVIPETAKFYVGTVVEYWGDSDRSIMKNVLAVEVTEDIDMGQWNESALVTTSMLIYTKSASEFCVGDRISFYYDHTAAPLAVVDGNRVWSVFGVMDLRLALAGKPVIYLYPEAPTEVSVKLTLDGELTCTYPAYGDGWDNFTAYPDGTLFGPDGKEYYCLYWEGKQNTVYDFSKGFCVKGSDTAAFLEWALEAQGLTPREANEFIIYWLPRLEANPYNVISFQTTAYTDGAVLEVTPTPDTLIRVFMAYLPSEVAVEIPAQTFEPVERTGFTAVEWGGTEWLETH